MGSSALGATLGGHTTDAIASGMASSVAVEDNTYFFHNNKLMGTDHVKNNMVVLLSDVDKERLFPTNLASMLVDFADTLSTTLMLSDYDKIQTVTPYPLSYFTTSLIYNLDNKEDFETLAKGTDMGYITPNEKTTVYFANGMDNTSPQALQSAHAISLLIHQPVGLIINSTDGIPGDTQEYLDSAFRMKDILNEYTYRKINNTADETITVVMYGAGNEDAKKALTLGKGEGYTYPNLQFVSVGSPISSSALEKTFHEAGASYIGQVNDWRDPVTYSKSTVIGALGVTAVGVYKGATIGASIEVENGPLEAFFYSWFCAVVGGGLGGAVGGGVGLYGIQNYHPFRTYLQNPQVQEMIKASVNAK